MKRILQLFIAFALLVVMAACGAEKDGASSDTENSKGKESSKTTLTIEHELDTVEVTKKPEKVVVFDFGILDTLDELGIEVAGLPKATVPAHLSKYKDEKYANLGSLKEPDFEEIHKLKPDVIFISSRQADLYEQFAEIAPTVYVGIDYENYMESFKKNMEKVGLIFEKEDEVNTALSDIDEQIAALHGKATTLDKKALIVLASQGKVSAYGPASRFGLIHDVFGFGAVDEQLEISTHGQNITFEYILEKNPDILFVIDRDVALGQGTNKEALENDLVKKTNAYKNDKIVYLNAEYWYLASGGLQSMREMVKEVEAGL